MNVPLTLFLLLASVPIAGSAGPAQSDSGNFPLNLYGGLTRGMTAEQAATAVLSLDGVKSAKLKKQKRPEVMCIDIDHEMSKGGDYGGQKGFPYVVCDAQGVKAVIVRFALSKNATPCLSNAAASYARLEKLLHTRYKEVERSKSSFDERFVVTARIMAAKERLSVTLGPKTIGSLEVVDPYVVFSDGARAIVLSADVRNWTYYEKLPNFTHAMCSDDGGWQAQPQIRYISMADWSSERSLQPGNNAQENAERDKRDADSL